MKMRLENRYLIRVTTLVFLTFLLVNPVQGSVNDVNQIPTPSSVDSRWNPVKTIEEVGSDIGSVVGAPFGGFIDSATKPTIQNVENVGHRIIADLDEVMEGRIAQIGDEVSISIKEADQAAEQRLMQADQITTARISQLDQSIEARMYQLDGIISESLIEVDRISEARIEQIDEVATNRIEQVDTALQERIKDIDDVTGKRIEQIDSVMENRIEQVDIVLDDAIVEIDQRIETRINQVDEIAETRIGNAEIVATKASLAFETVATRIIGFACLLAFLTFLLWRVVAISRENWELILKESSILNRAKKTWQFIGSRLLLQGSSGLIAAAIIFLAFYFLPGSEQSRVSEVARSHKEAYENSLAAFDFRRARFHASQLQLLQPEVQEYQGLALKADLIRNVLTRPGMLQTPQGLTEVMQMMSSVQIYLDDDPDIYTLQAYISWNTGITRDTEYEAARLAMLAIGNDESEPRKFALFPLAANYLNAYYLNPLPDAVAAIIHCDLHGCLLDERGEYLIEDREGKVQIESEVSFIRSDQFRSRHKLAQEKLEKLKKENEGISLAALRHILDYNDAASTLLLNSTRAYFAMLENHAKYLEAISSGIDVSDADISNYQVTESGYLIEPEDLIDFDSWNEAQQFRYRRLINAYEVVNAWRSFDEVLRNKYWLSGSTTALTSFRLNDALYSRAAWFVFNPNSHDLAPTLTGVFNENNEWVDVKLFEEVQETLISTSNAITGTGDITSMALSSPEVISVTNELRDDLARRVKIAPPRLRWIERYEPLFGDASRVIVNFQEYQRFRSFEEHLTKFDIAYLEYILSNTEDADSYYQAGNDAIEAAARLGFYIPSDETGKKGFLAQVILQELKEGRLNNQFRPADLIATEEKIRKILRRTRTPLL